MLFAADLVHMGKDFELDLSLLDPQRKVSGCPVRTSQIFPREARHASRHYYAPFGGVESTRFPQLILHFRQTEMNGFMGPITDYFHWLDEQGIARIANPLEASNIFSTLTGRPLERVMGVVVTVEEV